ncbi:MAG: hypothetical protein RI907_769 [Pseudomonadota bacterium]|jgi:hypothetical protein
MLSIAGMRRPSPRRQAGITLIGLLSWAVVIGVAAMVLMKVFPAITEYRTIQSMVNKCAREGGATVPSIRACFDKAKAVEYGVDLSSGELDISKENEEVVIGFAYDKEIELMAPVYLLIKFEGHSR